jgi:hypothetical protein
MHAFHSLIPPTAVQAACRMLCGGFAIALLLGYAPTIASAQYRSDPADKQAKLNSFIVKRVVRGEADYAAEKQTVQDYFTKYYFPAMTSTEPADLAVLDELCAELINDNLAPATNRAFQQDLNEWTLNAMKAIVVGDPAQPPYDPRVRYNAVLIVGFLDDPYATQANPARPFSKATGLLYTIVDSAGGNAGKSPYPPSVLLGALLGLERHAQLHRTNPSPVIPQVGVDLITTATLKIVTNDQPMRDVGQDEHAWIRLRAAGVLAQFGGVGKNNEVHNALLQLVSTFKAIEDRCEAAAMLAKLKYDGAQIDGAATAAQLLRLASDVGQSELARAVEFEDRQLAGGIGGRPILDRRQEPAAPKADEDKYPRRLLLTHLSQLREGLTSARPVVPTDAQAKFDAALTAIGPVLQAATDRNTVELELAAKVREMAGALNQIAAAPAAVPAAVPTVDGG